MTDQTQDLYDEASEEFAGKDDLKDRLVAIWVTGVKGQRTNPDGKPYAWVETITVALDDGPGGESVTELVGPAPERLDKFQLSASGLVSRLEPRITKKDAEGNPLYKPMVGRVNSRPNKIKGRTDSWSISKPTEDDALILDGYESLLRGITSEVREMRETSDSGAAFD